MQHPPGRSIRARLARRLLLCLVAFSAACGDPTGSPFDLVGSWHKREAVKPSGSMERIFRFDADFRFEQQILFYGVYGDPPSHLSASTSITGNYTTNGDHLVLHGETETDTDSTFYPEPVTRELNGAPLLDARFLLLGSELILFYDSYPADAPEPTTMRLTRMP